MAKETYCKICGMSVDKNKLKQHLKDHQPLDSLEPGNKKSIFGIREIQ